MAGDLVVIKKGQVIVLDMDTPILFMLIIKGRNLIYFLLFFGLFSFSTDPVQL